MRNKILKIMGLTGGLILCWFPLCAQQDSLQAFAIPDSILLPKLNSELRTFANFDQNASALTNAFVNQIYFGDAIISSDLKRTTSNRTTKTNRIGLDAGFGVCFRTVMKKSNPENWISVSLSNKYLASGKYKKDLWNVVAFGNKMYEDETAVFSGSSVKYLSGNALNISFGKRRSEKVKVEYGISAFRITSYQEINLTKGTLYTAPYGEYLDVEVGYSVLGSLGGGIGFRPSPGFALNGGVTVEIKNGEVCGSVSDMGVAFLSQVSSMELDSSFRFEGVQIDNVLSPALSGTNSLSADYLVDNFGGTADTSNKSILLPFALEASYNSKWEGKFNLKVALKLLHLKGYSPRLTVLPFYQINRGIKVHLPVTYGGFGSLNAGVGVQYQTRRISLELSSLNLNAMILGSYWSGQGVFIAFGYHF